MWALYHPRSPTFALDSLKVLSLDITPSSKLTCKFNLTVTARNPNKDIAFTYDEAKIDFVTVDKNVVMGSGVVPGFVHGKKNVTDLRVLVASDGGEVDEEGVKVVKMGLESDKGLALKVSLETEVKAKVGSLNLKTPMIPVKIVCDGISVKAGKKKVVCAWI